LKGAEMKRYYIEAYCRVCDCEIATKKRPSEYGDYYLVTDVERTMIPRPDAEAARKAVDEYTTAVIDDVMSCECIGPCSQVRRLKAALLRLMGVA